MYVCELCALTHSLNLSTNCGLFHPQPKEFECNLSLSHSALSLLLLFITRSLAAAAPTRTALLRCSNQCLRILLRALSLFDTIRLVSALGSAPRRLTHGSLTVDQYVCLARLQFFIVPQRQSKSNVGRVCVDTLRRSRRRRRSCRCRRVCVCVFLLTQLPFYSQRANVRQQLNSCIHRFSCVGATTTTTIIYK